MSDGTTATASGMDTHKRWFLLDYEPTSVRVCVCVCVVGEDKSEDMNLAGFPLKLYL